MIIFKHIEQLKGYLHFLKTKKHTIGFVPTMGALHEGHLSLLRRAQLENDFSICSIYVNPTQFNEESDLQKYPRPIQNDVKLLRGISNDILFLPTNKEIYPNGSYQAPSFDLEGLDEQMEGKFRPGHFEGVIMVVHRLLTIVNPDSLYMGQKDLQQFTIIKQMISKLDMSVHLVRCDIAREDNGLARSSRNERLSPEARRQASLIWEVLHSVKLKMSELSLAEHLEQGRAKLDMDPFKLEYLIAVDTKTLREVEVFGDSENLAICAAAWIDGVRLIDNLILKEEGKK
jgi:pantoate--beta-alanine ligase